MPCNGVDRARFSLVISIDQLQLFEFAIAGADRYRDAARDDLPGNAGTIIRVEGSQSFEFDRMRPSKFHCALQGMQRLVNPIPRVHVTCARMAVVQLKEHVHKEEG